MSIFRYQGGEINSKLANSEAEILHGAIKDRAFNHEEVIRVFTTRSKPQILATLNHYKDDHGSSITKVPLPFFFLFALVNNYLPVLFVVLEVQCKIIFFFYQIYPLYNYAGRE